MRSPGYRGGQIDLTTRTRVAAPSRPCTARSCHHTRSNLPEPTPAEKAEHDKLRKELETVNKEYRELSRGLYGDARVEDKEEREALEKKMTGVRQRMMEIRTKLPREYETHGWIWLFLRRK